MTETTAEKRVVESVSIAASRERVFQALTDPAEIPRWWGDPDQYQTERCEVDLRVGGAWKSEGTMADGATSFVVHGTYREIDPPGRLVYTWIPSWEEGSPETLVELDLAEADGTTTITVTHTGFKTPEVIHGYREGWLRVFGWLDRHLTG